MVNHKWRRGSAGQWAAANRVLQLAEPGVETDTYRFKLGDGETPWLDLPYFISQDEIAAAYQPREGLIKLEGWIAPDFRAMPTFMINPPTITVGTAGVTTSSISGAITVQPDASGAVTYSGAVPLRGDTYPDSELLLSNHGGITLTGIYEYPGWSAEFDHDGSVFEFVTRGRQVPFQILVNGQYATPRILNSPAYDGNLYLIKVDFGSRDIRRVRIEMNGLMPVGKFYLEPDAAIWASPLTGPRVVFMGDSFTEPTFADSSGVTYTDHDGWATVCSRLLGWHDSWVLGAGGTGYCNPGITGRVKFRDRVANDVIARNPNIVVVAGGFNDGAFSNTEIATEAGLMFNQIVDALPDVRLLVVSPFYPDTATSTIINRGLAIADQIPSGPHHHYIDVLTPSIITGTGDQDDNHNDGNADRYIGGDHVHPTFAGHQYMGRRIASIIQHTAL